MWKKANGRVTNLQINDGRSATTTPKVGETAGGHRVSGTQEGLESPDRSWSHSKCSCCWREGEIPQLPPGPPTSQWAMYAGSQLIGLQGLATL